MLFQGNRTSEALTANPPPTAGEEERRPKPRRVNQILSSSPGPEGNEVRSNLWDAGFPFTDRKQKQSTHSPGKALKSFDPETDLGVPKVPFRPPSLVAR